MQATEEIQPQKPEPEQEEEKAAGKDKKRNMGSEI